jgi:hypothetical protein
VLDGVYEELECGREEVSAGGGRHNFVDFVHPDFLPGLGFSYTCDFVFDFDVLLSDFSRLDSSTPTPPRPLSDFNTFHTIVYAFFSDKYNTIQYISDMRSPIPHTCWSLLSLSIAISF